METMNYLTENLLNPKEIYSIKTSINKSENLWEDGKKTAGSQAAKVKNNLQLSKSSEISKKYTNLISKKILANPLIKSFA